MNEKLVMFEMIGVLVAVIVMFIIIKALWKDLIQKNTDELAKHINTKAVVRAFYIILTISAVVFLLNMVDISIELTSNLRIFYMMVVYFVCYLYEAFKFRVGKNEK